MKSIPRPLAAATMLMAAGAAGAHHSYAMFDLTHERTLHGTVKAVEWTNPHVWIWVVGDADSSGQTVYGFETVSPGELERFLGWNRHVLAVGEKVTLVFAPLRSGRKGGTLRRIALSDGRVLGTPFTSRSPAPPNSSATAGESHRAIP